MATQISKKSLSCKDPSGCSGDHDIANVVVAAVLADVCGTSVRR
jgi:UDP-N-acetylmuramyl pentapeptide synthase